MEGPATAPAALEGFALCSVQSQPAGPVATAVPVPPSPYHRRHRRATALIAVPPLSLPCHCRHHRATAVIAVPPLSSPCHHHLCQQGTRRWPNLLGRVAGSGSLLCKLAFWVVTAFWGPGRNRLSPRVSGWVVGASTLRVCGQCQCWSNLLAHAGLPGTGSVAVRFHSHSWKAGRLPLSPSQKSSPSTCSVPCASMQVMLLTAATQSITGRAFPACLGGLGGVLLPKKKKQIQNILVEEVPGDPQCQASPPGRWFPRRRSYVKARKASGKVCCEGCRGEDYRERNRRCSSARAPRQHHGCLHAGFA